VAQAVAEAALGAPANETLEIAGPERRPLSALVARDLKATNDPREVVSDPQARYFGTRLDEHCLVPVGPAHLGTISLEDWLRQPRARSAQSAAGKHAGGAVIAGAHPRERAGLPPIHDRSTMTRTTMAWLLLSLMASPVLAQPPDVVTVMSKDLTEAPGREVVMLTVEYPPGGSDPVHRHDAHGFIDVLEGSVVMQVQGGTAVTLTPGQLFDEGPDDVHVVGRNASTTRPAKFLVLLVKDKGAPTLVPVK
jgi:quercetin dioxygenase-like cupin family protein